MFCLQVRKAELLFSCICSVVIDGVVFLLLKRRKSSYTSAGDCSRLNSHAPGHDIVMM